MDPITLLHVFPTFAVGGVPVRIIDVANRLGQGFRHHCISLDGRDGAIQNAWSETDFQMIPPDAQGGPAGVARLMRRLGADLLCTYNFGSMDWALMGGMVRGVAHLHFESGFGPEEAYKTLPRRNLYRRVALLRTKALVVPAQNLVRIARRGGWISSGRIRLIPNGVDCDWYIPHSSPTDGPPVLTVVAPLRREKRLDRLLDMLAKASCRGHLQVRICGDGPERPALEAQTERLGLTGTVRFLGHFKDVRDAFAGADLFAMTSETEQMPNALLQAMASGLAVVALDAGDVKIILPDAQRAHVHAQDDVAGFIASLDRLAQDRALARTMGQTNRDRAVSVYGMDKMIAAYRALYREAAERP